MELNLPTELVEFLGRGGQFDYDPSECEPGEVKLKRLNEVTLGEVWIDASTSADEEGYYAIPAVSLTGECEAYDPKFILLWLPQEKLFGAWDCDHWILTVFPETRWSAVVANPAAYLNAQWDAEPLGVPFETGAGYQRKPGRPF